MGSHSLKFVPEIFLKNLSFRMKIFVASLLFLSFIAMASCLKCWVTDDGTNDGKDKFYSMRATNTINFKECPDSANKSCKKEWYKVVSWGDFYYRLTCDSGAAQAEKSEEKGSTKHWTYSCSTDY